MEIDSKGIGLDVNDSDSLAFPLDTRARFEAWIDTLRDETRSAELAESETYNDPVADWEITCESAENCDIAFDGVLRLDGFLSGSIQSSGGTLITGPGSINADITAGEATIGGAVNGNISVDRRVVLRNHAKVIGNIKSSGLSVKPGSLCRGECDLRPIAQETKSENGTSSLDNFVRSSSNNGSKSRAGIAAAHVEA